MARECTKRTNLHTMGSSGMGKAMGGAQYTTRMAELNQGSTLQAGKEMAQARTSTRMVSPTSDNSKTR